MDPNATLHQIEEQLSINRNARLLMSYRIDAKRHAKELRGYLLDWLRSGGFPPEWDKVSKETRAFVGVGV